MINEFESKSENSLDDLALPNDTQANFDEFLETEPDVTEVEKEPAIILEKHWYLAQTRPGHEKKAELALRDAIRIRDLESSFGEILVPMEVNQVTDRNGKATTKLTKVFPSYIFIEMNMTFTTMELVRNTTHVIGFVGVQKGQLPKPLPTHEIQNIKSYIANSEINPKVSGKFEPGMKVLIKNGSYRDQEAEVVKINRDNSVEVKIIMFNRENNVTYNFSDLEIIK